VAWTAPIIPNPPAQYDQRIFEQRDRALNSALVLLARILPLVGSGSSGGGGGTPSGDYVSAFNGRIGNVTLLSADVTGALGFSPSSSTHNHTGTYALVSHTHTGLYAPVSHAHVIADTTGLQTALDGKAATAHNHDGAYSPVGHGHAVADVTGLQTALDGKAATTHDHTGVYAPVSHTHVIADTTGLQTALDGKAATSHTHSYEAAGAVAAHEAAGDPHPQYLTSTEGNAAYATTGHTHSGVYEPADATILKDADIGVTVAAQGHTHAQLHDAVTVSDSSSIDLTLTGQALSAAAIFGTTAGTVCQGNDSRLSDARAPTAHSHVISDVTGLQAALDGKQASGSYLTDAPSDGNEYVRKNGAWAVETDSGGGATDLSYTAATRVLASSTGAGATLPLVSSSDAGLAPASGGGTTNFLRADGTWAAPAGGSSPTVATLASDQATGANTTPVTLTGLSFSYAANAKYRIWFMGRVSPAAATTGCGFQFDLSSAVTSIDVQFFHQLASTGTLSGGHSIADDASVGVSSGLPGTGTYPVTGHGLLITTGNTGTAQLRFRSETTAVITAKAGLTLVVERIE